ncbi:hypothetical protein SDRG_07637 [Saprolegnia diclina VS20]|uniref:Tyrosine specific protein phosphatases domain-containing protein n=1 Tax=Saprolegnia diclina (strain VS20) TaxID=1156394 RepID=T0RQH1_SAPDV|nr:hypothetical protein SDRG_07637 [Saprolegnia diclina VS20]EQC34833.1 hypothetical protein SDRG_07637 [Saprolegnia diclina VS20]|eukprot:XP_008611705.1 hypothetical protein SDRG_07637 [Saprolegnia diclina VS20]
MQATAWSQRVHVCDRVLYVEWWQRPPASWWPTRRLVPYELQLPTSLSLGHVVRTAGAIDTASKALPPDHTLCISLLADAQAHRAKAICVIGAWRLLFHSTTAAVAHAPFEHLYLPPDPFSSSPTFPLHALDWLQGLEKAASLGFVSANLDVDEIERCASGDHGAITWSCKKLAVFQPSSLALSPYIPYFQKHNTRVVIALERPTCVDVVGVEYLDMTCEGESWDSLFNRFLEAVESSHGTVAVHCSSGLHRSQTCVGGFLMRTYGFSARQAIAWIRLVRPGSLAPSHVHALEAWERVWSGKSQPEMESALTVHIGSMTLGTSLFAKDAGKAKKRRDSMKPLTPLEGSESLAPRQILRVGSTPNRSRLRL